MRGLSGCITNIIYIRYYTLDDRSRSVSLICSAGARPHQWCLSGWNGSLRVMYRSGLLWGLTRRFQSFRSRVTWARPGHALWAVWIRLLKKADVFKL